MIEVLLGVSVVANILLVWYVVQLIKRLLNISEELEGLFVNLEEYSVTLENLLRHSKAVSEKASNFRAIYDVNYTEEEHDEEDI